MKEVVQEDEEEEEEVRFMNERMDEDEKREK